MTLGSSGTSAIFSFLATLRRSENFRNLSPEMQGLLPGKKLHRVMREGVNDFDRVIVICSKASLSRKGVLNEIEETLQREARDGGASYLIPIRIDDYIFRSDCTIDSNVRQSICDRVVADFTSTEADPAKFDRSLQKLIAALRKDGKKL